MFNSSSYETVEQYYVIFILQAGKPMQCELSMTNPLSKMLTECEVKLDGSVIEDRHVEEVRYANFKILPDRYGTSRGPKFLDAFHP